MDDGETASYDGVERRVTKITGTKGAPLLLVDWGQPVRPIGPTRQVALAELTQQGQTPITPSAEWVCRFRHRHSPVPLLSIA